MVHLHVRDEKERIVLGCVGHFYSWLYGSEYISQVWSASTLNPSKNACHVVFLDWSKGNFLSDRFCQKL